MNRATSSTNKNGEEALETHAGIYNRCRTFESTRVRGTANAWNVTWNLEPVAGVSASADKAICPAGAETALARVGSTAINIGAGTGLSERNLCAVRCRKEGARTVSRARKRLCLNSATGATSKGSLFTGTDDELVPSTFHIGASSVFAHDQSILCRRISVALDRINFGLKARQIANTVNELSPGK